MVTKMESFVKKIEELNKELKEGFKDALKESSDALFLKYPKLESFSWTQYTPYFNDGEPCEFGINEEPYSLIFNNVDIGEYSDNDSVYSWKTESLSEFGKTLFTNLQEYQELKGDVVNFIDDLTKMESTVRSLLGEGLVVVSRDGVEVEDYDHD